MATATYVSRGAFWRIFFSTKKSEKFIGNWAKTFRRFGQKISSGLLKLHSTYPEKHSEENFPEWISKRHFAEKNSNFWPKVSPELSNQHSTPPEGQLAGKKFFLRKLFLYYFRALMMQFQFFGVNSRQVFKACPEKQFEENVSADKGKRKNIGNWATIFRTFGHKYSSGFPKLKSTCPEEHL